MKKFLCALTVALLVGCWFDGWGMLNWQKLQQSILSKRPPAKTPRSSRKIRFAEIAEALSIPPRDRLDLPPDQTTAKLWQQDEQLSISLEAARERLIRLQARQATQPEITAQQDSIARRTTRLSEHRETLLKNRIEQLRLMRTTPEPVRDVPSPGPQAHTSQLSRRSRQGPHKLRLGRKEDEPFEGPTLQSQINARIAKEDAKQFETSGIEWLPDYKAQRRRELIAEAQDPVVPPSRGTPVAEQAPATTQLFKALLGEVETSAAPKQAHRRPKEQAPSSTEKVMRELEELKAQQDIALKEKDVAANNLRKKSKSLGAATKSTQTLKQEYKARVRELETQEQEAYQANSEAHNALKRSLRHPTNNKLKTTADSLRKRATQLEEGVTRRKARVETAQEAFINKYVEEQKLKDGVNQAAEQLKTAESQRKTAEQNLRQKLSGVEAAQPVTKALPAY